MNKTITVHMASHPPRRAGMLRRAQEILPQLGPDDRFRLWLNNYPDSILEELPKDDKRLVIVLAGKDRAQPDLKSFGKLQGIEDVPGYLLTIDDDIYYPRNYVQFMVDGVDRYHGMCIVTMHGGSFQLQNGSIPGAAARDHRINVEYWRGRGEPEQCHTCGMGITAFCPQTIGMQNTILECRVESGDDESVAVWAQAHEIPIIRLHSEMNWIRPDHDIHCIEPHYANIMGVCLANEKLFAWKQWHYPGMPAPRSPLRGPAMFHVVLAQDLKAIISRTLAPDAMAALVVDALINHQAMSVVRASDGERMHWEHGVRGCPINGAISSDAWRQRYGTAQGNPTQIGRDIGAAVLECDIYCPTASGWYMPGFDTWTMARDRTGLWGDHCFHYAWRQSRRWTPIFAIARDVMILHREAVQLCIAASAKFPCARFHPVVLTGCQDQAAILDEAKRFPGRLVLVSGGPAGKLFCHKLSRINDMVVLDCGEALAYILSEGD